MFLIALSLYLASTGATAPLMGNDSIAEGWAKHYRPNLFRQVLQVRQRQGLIPWGVQYDGLASSVNCEDIGQYRYVSIRNPRTRVWSPVRRVLVADCSDPTPRKQKDGRWESDRDRHIREGLICEVDYSTAEATGFAWDGRRGEGKARARVWGAE